jgi:hypothetical protein
LQIVNHYRFSGVVCRRVFAPVQIHRAVTGIVIDPEVFMQTPMLVRQFPVSQQGVDEAEIVVGRGVFRVELQGFHKPLLRLAK